jgi:hypothetical protein
MASVGAEEAPCGRCAATVVNLGHADQASTSSSERVGRPTRAATAALALAALLAACGSSRGPGRPYALRDVEAAFRDHHVDTGRFGDMSDRSLPAGLRLDAADLKRGVVVGFAWGRPVSVWVFSNARAAKKRAELGRRFDPPVTGIRKGNVIVEADWPYLPRAQRRRLRAALADLH